VIQKRRAHGPGVFGFLVLPSPRYFDATTLAEIASVAARLATERTCSGGMLLEEPVDGRVYRGEEYSRYVFYAAFQPFQHGLMIWRSDMKTIYVLYSSGQWTSYLDT
jgi:hypothetical protein